MYEITLSGSPYERGLIQGRTFAEQIRDAFGEYCRFEGTSLGRVSAYKERMLSSLEGSFPGLVEELRGISDGAGMHFDDILMLNFFPGIINLPIYCTNTAFMETVDGPIHGKTSDIGPDYRYYLLQRTRPEAGEEFLSVGWVGTIWSEVGINARGLAMGQSSAPTAPGQDGSGISALIMPRPVLQYCSSTREAIDFLRRYKMAGKGLNMLLLDSSGDAVVVEKSYDRQAVREAEEGAVFCSNHFIDESMQGMIPLRIAGIEENSRGRYKLLTRILKEDAGPRSFEGMKGILRHHGLEGSPGICQHVSPDLATWYAYIQFPEKREMWIADGPPCKSEFVRHSL